MKEEYIPIQLPFTADKQLLGESDATTGVFPTLTNYIVSNKALNTRLGIEEWWPNSPWKKVWTVQGNLNTARTGHPSGFGTQGASVCAGGKPTAPTHTDTCELYSTANTWAMTDTLSQQRSVHAGFGTSTNAGAVVGGAAPALRVQTTEEYTAATWSAGGNLSEGTSYTCGCGSLTTGLVAGGIVAPGSKSDKTENYNGTAWSLGDTLVVAESQGSVVGNSSTALYMNGDFNADYRRCYDYDGVAWGVAPSLQINKTGTGVAGEAGGCINFGGVTSPNTYRNETEIYDGVAWSYGGDLNVTRAYLSGSGTQELALSWGGQASATALDDTEEWS